ncbi:MAG: hypothetical protein U0S36_00340 [Candidatus Nanopelagicales bacterium]
MLRRRAGALALALVAGSTLLSSCARPDFQYAAQKPGDAPAGTVFFKVPQGWNEFPAGQIAKAQSEWAADPTARAALDVTSWQSAYDASIQPSLANVLGRGVPTQPTLYASLRRLYDDEAGKADLAALRDMVVPVSTLGTQVKVVTDEKVSQGGASGVHLVFSYAPEAGAPEQTIDQTAYLSEGNDAVYLLLVRCSTACYDNHRDEISTVTSSFTIQEGRSG